MRIKWSKYNLVYSDDSSQTVILSNSITSNTYKLNLDLYSEINCYVCSTQEKSNKHLQKIIAELFFEKFLVDEEINEKELVEKQLTINKEINDVGNVYFIPSFECDFRCTYCIEGINVDNKNKKRMDSQEVYTTARWINEVSDKLSIKKLSILLFGGEPLLSYNENILLMQSLNEIKGNKSIDYSLITNGYLITREKIENLIKNNLSSVQITFDGPKHIHDSRRKHCKFTDTFDVILKNLLDIIDLPIRIIVRINVDEQNCLHIEDLLRLFVSFKLNKKITLHIVPVDPSPYSHDSGYTEDALNAYYKIYQYAFSNGFHVEKWRRYCSISAKMNFSIDPDGDVYPCPNFVGDKKYLIGSIYSGLNEKYTDIRLKKLDSQCYDCKYLGLCNGGCLSMKLLFNTNKCLFYKTNHIINGSYMIAKYENNTFKRDNLKIKFIPK